MIRQTVRHDEGDGRHHGLSESRRIGAVIRLKKCQKFLLYSLNVYYSTSSLKAHYIYYIYFWSDRHVDGRQLEISRRQRRLYDKISNFFQTTYRAYTIHRYKKIRAEGPTTVLGVQDGEGDGKVTAVNITIDGLTGARQMLTVDGPSDPLSGGKSTWLNRA